MAGKILSRSPSLIFIGMPAAGKTTIGRLCAGILGLPFIDFDEMIEGRMGATVREIFASEGEGYFRQLESELAIEFSRRGGIVISPGGGIVERQKNMEFLASGNLVCRLERDIAMIDSRGRPLLKDEGAAQRLLERRGPLYTRYADFTLDNNGLPMDCAIKAAGIYKEKVL